MMNRSLTKTIGCIIFLMIGFIELQGCLNHVWASPLENPTTESTTTRTAGGLDFSAIGGKRQGREVPQSLRVWKTQSIRFDSDHPFIFQVMNIFIAIGQQIPEDLLCMFAQKRRCFADMPRRFRHFCRRTNYLMHARNWMMDID